MMFYKTPSRGLTSLSLNDIAGYARVLNYRNGALTIHCHAFNAGHDPDYGSLIKLPTIKVASVRRSHTHHNVTRGLI